MLSYCKEEVIFTAFTGNAQLMLDEIIKQNIKKGVTPKLLLHSCCAPCSSYVLEYLKQYFMITVYYYNPNIFPEEEFYKRSDEQARFTKLFTENQIPVVQADYDCQSFYEAVKGLEQEPEGGERCRACFRLRLGKTAEYAKQNGFDYFTTTLSISPHKNAAVLNAVGMELEKEYNVAYLFADFKKRNGYLRSCEISKTYEIYRQDYCGCVFSKREKAQRNKEKAEK